MQTTKKLTSEIRDATRNLAALGGQRLLHVVLDAVQSIDDAELRAAAPGMAPFRPQMLLTLLTWSYASGLYSSQDITTAMNCVRGTPRYICAGSRPGWRVLRKFRREHRAWLEQCLTAVLKQAWALQVDDGDATFRGLDWFENELAAGVAEEMKARLELAAIIDGAESE